MEDYNYSLDESLIAQKPIKDRSQSKLLVMNKYTGELKHQVFHDMIDFLKKGDVLVLNDTKVIPARLFGVKKSTKAHLEILLLKDLGSDIWSTIIRNSRRLSAGDEIDFGGLITATVLEKELDGEVKLKLNYEGILYEILDKLGEMPLPPYIHEKLNDQNRYQTIYAKNIGSVAAPTAGLHFTDELLNRLKAKGIIICSITLHVGLGTFRPVAEQNILDHKMHSEYYEINEATAKILNAAKIKNHKIIAVGTTTVRTLETVMAKYGTFKACKGETDIFIYPGFKFKGVDSLITNFHLPKSTLLMLVSALSSKEYILNAYNVAIKNKYRFFSFGDAMFIDATKRKSRHWKKVIKKTNLEKPYLKKYGYKILRGGNNIMLSAPHAHKHLRNNSYKDNEYNTGSIVKILHQYTDCHIIYTYKNVLTDANKSECSSYKKNLIKYIKANNIKYLIDIHGISDNYPYSIELGTNYLKNLNNDKYLIKKVKQCFKNNGIKKIEIDNKYKASKNTISYIINKECKIKTIQIEIANKYRKRITQPVRFNQVLRSLNEIIDILKEGL